MQKSDVIVIGAGVIGCSIALELAERGLEVTLVERGAPGGEASSVAAGILAARIEYASDPAMGALSVESRELHAEQAARLREEGLDVGFRRHGALLVAIDPARLEALARGYEAHRIAYERLDPEGLRALEPQLSSELQRGLFLPDEASLEPPRLLSALVASAEKRGVRLLRAIARGVRIERGRARGIELEGEPRRLDGGAVVVATGSWSSLLAPEQVEALAPLRRVEPVRGQLVHLEAPSSLLGRVVFGEGGYVVPRGDGRYVVGATSEPVGFDPRITAHGVRHVLDRGLTLLPALERASFVEARANLRPASPDGRPLVGRGAADGLFLATGHFRNGILLAPITARLIAGLVTRSIDEATDPRLSLLSPTRAFDALERR